MLEFTIVGRTKKDLQGKTYLLAETTCKCGIVFRARKSNLMNGQQSCGCKKGNRSHGMTRTRPYRAWRNMLDRCTNPDNKYWARYGGRGISFVKKWQQFEGFWEDMQESYEDTLSLDRIENDGNYCKTNCRWATNIEQSINKSNSITFKGESARQAGIRINGNPSLVYQRLNAGMCKEKAFTLPSKRQR